MIAQIVQAEGGKFILCEPGQGKLRSEQDILDLMGLFGKGGAYLLLIAKGALHQDFFDLSSGLAGKICLKLSSYRVKTAFVIDLDSITSQPFQDWAGECNRGRELRFCADRVEAENWLLDHQR